MAFAKAFRSAGIPLLVVLCTAFSVFHFSSCGGGAAGGAGGGGAATTTTTMSTAPSTPTITIPSASPYYSTSTSLTIAGACTTGATVTLAGDSSQTYTCASSAYTFSVTKTTDAAYAFTVKQTVAGVDSATASLSWTLDRVAPSAPTITGPGSSPYVSADSTFNLTGACETGATVTLAGDSTGSATCSGSAYSVSIGTKSSDTTYNFTVSQADPSGNASGNASFQWTRDTTVPATPTITSPTLTAGVYYSTGNSVTIQGGCVTGNTVTLAGASSQTFTCALSAYSFTYNSTSDGSYAFTVKQKHGSAQDSGTVAMTWTRDTVAPSAPAVTGPGTSPYNSPAATTAITITGGCETNATVSLGGATAQTKTCASSAYGFNSYNPGSDGTYNFTVSQTDPSGNASGNTNFQWIRDTASPTISSVTPATSSGNLTTATNIALNGSGYKSSGMTITVDGATCSNFVFTSPTDVSCDAPGPHLAQAVNVVVTKANGASVTSSGGFTYTGTAAYTLLQQKIFQVYCASCHISPNLSGGFDLSVYSQISLRVTAGDAANSTLYKRVTTQAPIMPQGGAPLTTAEKNAIADWINAGASNN